MNDAHLDCSSNKPCAVGDPASCPREDLRAAKRLAKQEEWAMLDLRTESGSSRHYLDDRPVHCSDQLELQAVEDRFTKGGDAYLFPLQSGIPVRYEAAFGPGQARVTLFAAVGGHDAAIRLEAWMRLRWPT